MATREHRPAGLDPTQLAARRRRHPAETDIPRRIREHLDSHDGYLALSGGKDSVVCLHLTLTVEPNVPVVFFDSGFEFPETYRYLAQLRRDCNLNLHWYRARRTTLEVLAASGAWNHDIPRAQITTNLHELLISEPAARAHHDHGPGELWGVRAEESRGRAAFYAAALAAETTRSCHGCCSGTATPATARRRTHGGIVRRNNATVALGPIWDWKTSDVWAYLARHRLPVNPVYDKLRRLGAPNHLLRVSHLLDGSRLEDGRITYLRRGWPDLFEDLTHVLPRLREYI